MPVVASDEDDKTAHEYKAKTVLIYNFLKFVEWPGNNSPMKTRTANVCIIGDKEFSEYFKAYLQARQTDIKVNLNSSVSGNTIPSCHILFIGRDEEENALSILAHTKNHPVLTISGAKDFADNGGIIELVRVGEDFRAYFKDRINLRINLKTAEDNNLSIDARLLQLAAEVIK